MTLAEAVKENIKIFMHTYIKQYIKILMIQTDTTITEVVFNKKRREVMFLNKVFKCELINGNKAREHV